MSQARSTLLLGDIDALFCAVTARLRRIADRSGLPLGTPAPVDPNDRVRTEVLDCVSALDTLHAMLAHEIARRERLEQIVVDAQAALAEAPPELVAVFGPLLRLPPGGLAPGAAHAS